MIDSNSLNCDECREVLEEFALGELSPAAAAQVSSHLAKGCPACNRQLVQIAADLALTVHAVPTQLPPLRIERDLMQRIAKGDSTLVSPSHQSPSVGTSHRNRAYAFATALAALLFGVAAWSVWQNTPRDPAVPPSDAAAFQSILRSRINHADAVEPLATVPQLKFAYLRRPAAVTNVSGYLAIDESVRQWHLYLFDLPPLGEGKKYQAWFVSGDGQYIPASLLDVDSEGAGSLVLDLPSNESTIVGIAISDEPTTGSKQPTGETFLRTDLP